MGEPLYSLNASIVSRGTGGTAARTCAYVMRARLADSQRATPANYADYHDPALFKGIFAPAISPANWRDIHAPVDARAEEICRTLEAVNDNSSRWRDAQLGRHFKIALFPQLTLQQNLYIAQDWIKENVTRPGYIAIAAIHPAPEGGDPHNLHLHLFVPDRKVTPDGFANTKDRAINQKSQLDKWRKSWADTANRHFARWGLDYVIDSRSYAAQGIDKIPQVHLGPKAKQLEEEGYATELGNKLRAIDAENRKRGYKTTKSRGTMRNIIERDRVEPQHERASGAPKKRRRRGNTTYVTHVLADLADQQAAAGLTGFDDWQRQPDATLGPEGNMPQPQPEQQQSRLSKLGNYVTNTLPQQLPTMEQTERVFTNYLGALFDAIPGMGQGKAEGDYGDPEKKFHLHLNIEDADIKAGKLSIDQKTAETLTGRQEQSKDAEPQKLNEVSRDMDMDEKRWREYQMQGAVQYPEMDEEEYKRDY